MSKTFTRFSKLGVDDVFVSQETLSDGSQAYSILIPAISEDGLPRDVEIPCLTESAAIYLAQELQDRMTTTPTIDLPTVKDRETYGYPQEDDPEATD